MGRKIRFFMYFCLMALNLASAELTMHSLRIPRNAIQDEDINTELENQYQPPKRVYQTGQNDTNVRTFFNATCTDGIGRDFSYREKGYDACLNGERTYYDSRRTGSDIEFGILFTD